jgi:ribonuclease Z
MEIIFLGTSGGLPTKDRNLPAIAIRSKGKIILLDCGEGCQIQMVKAGLSLLKVTHILITHLHGDHFLGLPGLLQTCKLLNRKRGLDIIGPPGLADFMADMEKIIRVSEHYDINISEVHGGETIEHPQYIIKCKKVKHSVHSLAFSLEEKPHPRKFRPENAKELEIPKGPLWKKLQMGKTVQLSDGRIIQPSQVSGPPVKRTKIVYSGDTLPCPEMVQIASNADILIHESTYTDSQTDRALETQHSTTIQAAGTAKQANVKKLILTHISPRYKSADEIVNEAKTIFANTSIANDLQRVET